MLGTVEPLTMGLCSATSLYTLCNLHDLVMRVTIYGLISRLISPNITRSPSLLIKRPRMRLPPQRLCMLFADEIIRACKRYRGVDRSRFPDWVFQECGCAAPFWNVFRRVARGT